MLQYPDTRPSPRLPGDRQACPRASDGAGARPSLFHGRCDATAIPRRAPALKNFSAPHRLAPAPTAPGRLPRCFRRPPRTAAIRHPDAAAAEATRNLARKEVPASRPPPAPGGPKRSAPSANSPVDSPTPRRYSAGSGRKTGPRSEMPCPYRKLAFLLRLRIISRTSTIAAAIQRIVDIDTLLMKISFLFFLVTKTPHQWEQVLEYLQQSRARRNYQHRRQQEEEYREHQLDADLSGALLGILPTPHAHEVGMRAK